MGFLSEHHRCKPVICGMKSKPLELEMLKSILESEGTLLVAVCLKKSVCSLVSITTV